MKNITAWFHGIRGQLLFAAALPIVAFVMVGFISVRGVTEVNTLLRSSHKDIIPNILVIGDLRLNRNAFAQSAFSAINNAIEGRSFETQIEEATKSLENYKKDYQDYSKTTFQPE